MELGINVVRGLAMDAPEQANSGHSGTAMALAPLAHVLWTRIMRHDPHALRAGPTATDSSCPTGTPPSSCTPCCYLTGYDLTLDDIRQFRQWESRTPGHPERLHTDGVEVTTGPLGQGVGNAVGMAIAERALRARFGSDVCDHRTFVIAGDGCFMEGISHEAASLAGHLRLGRLMAFYDDNHITIDGPTELAYNDNVPERFAAYGWNVRNLGEMANDVDGLEAAIREAMEAPADGPEARPTLLILRSHIGWPSPKLTDTAAAHGSPFGAEEIRVTKEILGLPPDETFWVPDEVRAFYAREAARGETYRREWEARFDAWDGDRAAWDAAQAGRGLPGWADGLPSFEAGTKLATRHAINQCINATAAGLPGLIAGSADLTGNNGVLIKGAEVQAAATPGGAPAALRDPRARHGCGDERHGAARRHPPGRGDLLRLHRLHASRRSAGRPLAGPRDLLVDPRLHRPGRGRPDPPTRRTAGQPAGHAGIDAGAPRRRQRDGPGLAARRGVGRARRAGAHRARTSRCWPRRRPGPGRGWRRAATSWPRRRASRTSC